MKVNLVVTAAGANYGKSIPIQGAKFLIGRDAHCNLRPASQAISKLHCVLHVRNGQVFIQDLSSTNGTVVNDVVVETERQLMDGDAVKVGPLEFKVEIVPVPTPADGTPLPSKMTPLAAVPPKAATQSAPAQKPAAKSTPGTKPAPSTPAQKPASTPATAPVATTAPAPAPQPQSKPKPEPIKSATGEGDDAAAMLLSMDEDNPSGEQPSIPEGSTVMEIPMVDASGRLVTPPKAEKKPEAAESASAASDLLKKYFRRSSS